jgi:hypothetical protein
MHSRRLSRTKTQFPLLRFGIDFDCHRLAGREGLAAISSTSSLIDCQEIIHFLLEAIEILENDLRISSLILFPRRLPLIALSLDVASQPILFEAFFPSWF